RLPRNHRMETKTAVSRPKAYLKARQKLVKDAMKSLEVDALMLTHPPDLAYLSNFTGDDSVGILTDKGPLYLVTDFRYEEQVQIEAGWVKPVIREGKMTEALVDALIKAKVKRVAFETNYT